MVAAEGTGEIVEGRIRVPVFRQLRMAVCWNCIIISLVVGIF